MLSCHNNMGVMIVGGGREMYKEGVKLVVARGFLVTLVEV